MSTNKKNRSKRQTPKPKARSPAEEATGSGRQAPGDPPEARSPKPEASSVPILPIYLPIGELSKTGYVTGHVEVNHLSAQQKEGLNRLWNGLRELRGTLKDRIREVNTPADAVRWMLEQVAEQSDLFHESGAPEQ